MVAGRRPKRLITRLFACAFLPLVASCAAPLHSGAQVAATMPDAAACEDRVQKLQRVVTLQEQLIEELKTQNAALRAGAGPQIGSGG